MPNCLSIQPTSMSVTFRAWHDIGKIVSDETNIDGKRHANVHCFPFYSVMRALNRTKVDYFSLDVEGSELAILKTIPFDEIEITVSQLSNIYKLKFSRNIWNNFRSAIAQRFNV